MPSNANSRGQAEQILSGLVEWAEGPALITTATRRLLARALHSGPLAVIGDAHHALLGTAADEISPLAPSAIAGLQRRLRAFLRAVVDLDGSDGGGPVPTITVSRLEFGVVPMRRSAVLIVDGAPADLVLYQVVQLLQAVGVDRLRRCDAPAANSTDPCGRLFVAAGKRRFCSAACRMRLYMRGYRE